MGFLITEHLEISKFDKQPYILDYTTEVKFYAYSAMHLFSVSRSKSLAAYLQERHRSQHGLGAL